MSFIKQHINFFCNHLGAIKQDGQDFRLILTLTFAHIVTIVSLILFSIIAFYDHNFFGMFVDLFAAFFLICNIVFYHRSQNFIIASNLLYVDVVGLLFIQQMVATEPYVHNYFWGCLVPIFAALLNNKRTSFIWALIVAAFFSGSYLYVIQGHVSQFAFTVPNGSYPAYFLINMNISIFVAFVISYMLVDELNAKQRSLDVAYDKNNDLINVMTNNVEIPLAQLKSMLDNFATDVDDHAIKRSIDKAQSALNSLDRIYANANFTKVIGRSDMKLNLSTVELSSCIQNVLQMLHDKILEKQITVLFDQAKYSNFFVIADRSALELNILTNILSNAIKFSNVGGIVEISIERHASFVHLIFKDYGIGMNSEELDRIFLQNIPTTKCGTLGEVGSGFGMPIVKAITEKMGGKVEVVSTYQVGTIVTVVLVEG